MNIIVSLTSWPKRIDNVAIVIKSILNQTVKPDIIQINLSVDEFKNKYDDLPEELNLLIQNNKEIYIEWIDRNTGVFKKIIPTLQKHYGEEYYLLSIDDDWIYRNDYIELMINYLETLKGDSFCLSNYIVIGNRMIYKSSCFKSDFWEKLTDEVIQTRIDDTYIEHYLKSYSKHLTCYRPEDTPDITKKFNPVFPNSKNTVTGEYSYNDIQHANNVIKAIKFN